MQISLETNKKVKVLSSSVPLLIKGRLIMGMENNQCYLNSNCNTSSIIFRKFKIRRRNLKKMKRKSKILNRSRFKDRSN